MLFGQGEFQDLLQEFDLLVASAIWMCMRSALCHLRFRIDPLQSKAPTRFGLALSLCGARSANGA